MMVKFDTEEIKFLANKYYLLTLGRWDDSIESQLRDSTTSLYKEVNEERKANFFKNWNY